MGQLPLNQCDAIRKLLSASLDGELPELDAVRLDAHLAFCGGCRGYAAELAGTARLLRAAPPEQLSIPIVVPGRRLAVARKLQVAAAAAALLMTVGLSAALSRISSPSHAHVRTSVKAAKLRFPEQELRMLQRASQARSNNIHSPLAF